MINWFCHMYPYGNLHELNLDWVIATVKNGEKEIADFIGVNTIKYANPILWNITSQYEANTVVVDGQTGNAYISVKAVPSGVHLNREEYWTQIYNYANVVDTLREQIAYNEGESTTATRPYLVDDLVFVNGVLYRVIAPMIAGDSFVVDSNVVQTTINAEISRLHGFISDEVTARENADTQLQTNIDNEATARENADTQLQTNIDNEATARENADTTLGQRITDEASARVNADTQLQTNIDNEATAREDADTQLQDNIEDLEEYINSLNIPKNNMSLSIVEFHHEDTGEPLFYITSDGINMSRLPLPTPPAVGRDGSLCIFNDKIYMSVTWYSDDFTTFDTVIYSTDDLQNWIKHEINLNFSSIGRTWASDLCVIDNKLCFYVSHEDTLNAGDFKLYYCECTDTDTLTFNTPLLCTGITNPAIDGHYFEYKGVKYLLTKNETTKQIELYNWLSVNTFERAIYGDTIFKGVKCEAPTTFITQEGVTIMCDRYLDVSNHIYGTQTPIVVRTNNLVNYGKVIECNISVNEIQSKVSKCRHGSYLMLNAKFKNILYNLFPYVIETLPYISKNVFEEHLNIEDFGTINGDNYSIIDNIIAYPHTVYCIFDNPTGVVTPTAGITLNNISNPYNLDDFYLYVEGYIGKVINIPSRDIIKQFVITNQMRHTMLHFVKGVDGLFTIVGENSDIPLETICTVNDVDVSNLKSFRNGNMVVVCGSFRPPSADVTIDFKYKSKYREVIQVIPWGGNAKPVVSLNVNSSTVTFTGLDINDTYHISFTYFIK